MDLNERSLDNRRLVVLLDTLKDSPSQEGYEELFTLIAESSYFYTAANFSRQPVRQKDGSYLLENDTDISFPLLADGEGEHYYPVFTDVREMEKWKDGAEGASVLTLCIDDFLDMLTRDPDTKGIVINAFTQSFIVHTEMLKHLKEVRDKDHPFNRHTILQHLDK